MVPIFMTSWNGTLQHTQDTFPLKIAEATFVVVFSISRISEHMYIVQLSTWMGWVLPKNGKIISFMSQSIPGTYA